MPLEPLEAAVLHKLLEGDGPVLAALRDQLPGLDVKSRELTGAGFFVEFSTAAAACPAPIASGSLRFGDVEATIGGLKHGAGFVLYVEGGLLHMLEGYSYEETWPARVVEFSLRYSDPNRSKVLATLR